MLFRVTTRMRLPRPRWMSSVARMPASMVLPKPTASAIKMRLRGWRSACNAGSSWYGAMAEVNLRIVRHGPAALTLDGEQGGVEHRTGVSDQLRLGGVQNLNRTFQRGQEQRGLSAHQVRHAVAGQQATAITGRVHPPHEPFLVAHDNTGSRC